MRFNLVYGNHGSSPTQIEDILRYLRCGLVGIGHSVQYHPDLVDDACNIVLENFTSKAAESIVNVAKRGHDVVTVVTEAVTFDTFNGQAVETPQSGDRQDPYNCHAMWKSRFDAFIKVAAASRAIWCVADFLLDGYYGLTNPAKVHLLPLQYVDGFATVQHRRDEQKNIDCLFTGTLNRRRLDILNALRLQGAKVMGYPFETPSFIRDDAIGRSKICLNIMQTDNWKHLSALRIFYHVMNHSYVISERFAVPNHMEKYVDTFDKETFVAECLVLLNEGQYAKRAHVAHSEFREANSGPSRLKALLDLTFP